MLDSVKTEDSDTVEVDTDNETQRNSNKNNVPVSPPVALTNFSINEILKSNFGTKRISLSCGGGFSAFTPVKSHRSRDECSSPVSPTSSTYSEHEATSPLSPITPVRSKEDKKQLWPAWVYCTRYSDRPSSGPRSRKMRKKEEKIIEEKRPRTAFTAEQLQRLKREFEECRYLTEQRRRDLSQKLNLSEAQIKIWFQNKRAKIKKSTGLKNSLALHLMAQGASKRYSPTSVEIDREINLLEIDYM